MDSYASKARILNSNLDAYDTTISQFDSKIECIQTKFLKFVLNITKFSSNHAIRAELGKFPLSIQLYTKLVKYWHRLENLEDDSILSTCYKTCKYNHHDWYTGIINFLDGNGMNYISKNPKFYSEEFIISKVLCTLQDQYIQSWDKKAKSTNSLQSMYLIKRGQYKKVTILIRSHQ